VLAFHCSGRSFISIFEVSWL